MNVKSITKNAMPAVGVTAGVIAGRKVADLVPVGNEYARAGIVTVLGLFLSTQKGFVGSVGLGMAAQGINLVAANIVPGITGFSASPVFISGQETASSDGGQNPGYDY